MQIFEFHFNPKSREDRFFDTFIYEPEKNYEKNLGSLYVVGELQNTLPHNSGLLDNISQALKTGYYHYSFKNPERAFSETLKKANYFLSEEIKKENVSWLGNLNLAALSLKDFNLNFTKTGDLKVLLLRQGRIIDIAKSINSQDIDPYPLKVFFNVVSGKLAENDIILILTNDVFNFFSEQGILNKISRSKEIDNKSIKEILPAELFKKGAGAKISGVCFLARAKKDIKSDIGFIFKKNNKFSFKQALSPIFYPFKKAKAVIFSKKKKIKFPKIAFKFKNKKNKKWLNIPFLPKTKFKITKLGAKPLLILSLIPILLIGFLIFKTVEVQQEKKVKIPLEEIEKKVNSAQSFLIIKDYEKANSLFKEAWLEIAPLAEKETKLEPEILSLKKLIEKNLKELNNLEEIENPELLFEMAEFSCQNILYFNSNIYLYKPDSSIIYIFNLKDKTKTSIDINAIPYLGDDSSGIILFFSKPNTIIYLKDNEWQKRNIELSDFSFDSFSSYLSNLYFLDKSKSQIIKYSSYPGLFWNQPQVWLKNKIAEEKNPQSITINNSIWVLNKDNSIDLFYRGEYQETVTLKTFPELKEIKKIKTRADLPYLYVLEPSNKRIIVFDKGQGKILKQFQSEKFNNLKDFTVSENGKTIWLLNDLKVYKLEF